jgi:hypothetical protein
MQESTWSWSGVVLEGSKTVATIGEPQGDTLVLSESYVTRIRPKDR